MEEKQVERYVSLQTFDVFVINSFQDRLPFLDTGIVDILAKATGGLGVVLEHRYYGTSISLLYHFYPHNRL